MAAVYGKIESGKNLVCFNYYDVGHLP